LAHRRHNRAVVVETDAGFARELQRELRARNLRVHVFGNGREALAAVEREPAQIFIIAAKLPEMSGFDLARSVRRQTGPDAVVLVITDVAWSPAQKSAALQQMGLSDLLVRPIEARAVVETALNFLSDTAVSAPLPPVRTGPPSGFTPLGGSDREGAPTTESNPNLADLASQQEQREVERAARIVQSSQVEMRGNLGATPFPRLLHTLYRRRATGGLFLLRDSVKKIVYFKRGHPSYVKSNLLSECLGKVLVREGLITEGQCKDSLRIMKESRRQQGTVLVELGIISPQNLVVGLELQLRAKLMDIFAWSRGEYLFKSDAKLPTEVIRLDMSTAALIVDGIRQIWGAQRLEEALEPYWEMHLRPNTDPELRFQELALTEDEQGLLEAVDGVRTVRQLLAETSLPRQRAMAIAYALLCNGAVEAGAAPAAQQEAAVVRPPSRSFVRTPDEPLREQLAQQLLSLRQRDAYGVLGVAAGASDAAIEQAYSRLAREYHPDRFRGSAADTRQLADEIFAIIYQAYRKIATAQLRDQYRQRYTTQELREVSASGGDTLSAEKLKREALELGERGQWAQALERMDRAVHLRSGAGDLWSLHAWAIYQADPHSPSAAQKASRELRRAIELDPKQHEAYLFLGRIYSAMGKAILAEKQFEKALQCKPDCTEALEALRQQRARRPPRRGPTRY
jgi:DNA-binding response OmpR family regulator/tetratricopeptide (TPR) repeat protein